MPTNTQQGAANLIDAREKFAKWRAENKDNPLPQETGVGEGFWKAVFISVLILGFVVYASAMYSELITILTSFRVILWAGIGLAVIGVVYLIWFLNRAFRGWDWSKW